MSTFIINCLSLASLALDIYLVSFVPHFKIIECICGSKGEAHNPKRIAVCRAVVEIGLETTIK